MENETCNFDVQIARGIKEIGQETWDQLGREQPFASYRWYSFGEKVLTKDAPSPRSRTSSPITVNSRRAGGGAPAEDGSGPLQ